MNEYYAIFMVIYFIYAAMYCYKIQWVVVTGLANVMGQMMLPTLGNLKLMPSVALKAGVIKVEFCYSNCEIISVTH